MEKQRVISSQTGECGWLLDVMEITYKTHNYGSIDTDYYLVGIVAMDSGDIVDVPINKLKIEDSIKGGKNNGC